MAKQDKHGGGWAFPAPLEILICKEGNKEYMKERRARRPFGRTVLICEYPIEAEAAAEPDGNMITWRPTKRQNAAYTTRRKRTGFRKAGIAAARFSAIHLTDAKSESGFKRRTKKQSRGGIPLYYLSPRGRIQAISTITYTEKRKSASFAGGFASRTKKATPPIPRPSLRWLLSITRSG